MAHHELPYLDIHSSQIELFSFLMLDFLSVFYAFTKYLNRETIPYLFTMSVSECFEDFTTGRTMES